MHGVFRARRVRCPVLVESFSVTRVLMSEANPQQSSPSFNDPSKEKFIRPTDSAVNEQVEAAMSGNELRAALELEAHIRATPDLLIKALREGRAFLPGTVQLMRN